MPKVSVLLSVYNGRKFIEECINSILNQTYKDWEFIIVNEYGSDEITTNIIRRYAKKDSRFILIQNTKKIGLAASLNVGIENASGEYIARVDVDDPSYPDRFEKQVHFLDSHPDVVLCGTLQKSMTPQKSYVQQVPCEPEELKASMLFGCDINHCSVMLRRKVFIDNGWRYNEDVLGEDYDLWTKIMFDYKIANLHECLVVHRWGFENISIKKGEALKQESREISRRCLEKFDLFIPDDDIMLLSNWRNKPIEYAEENKEEFLRKGFQLIRTIIEKNREKHIIEEGPLKKVLYKRLEWILETCKLPHNFSNKYNNALIKPIIAIIINDTKTSFITGIESLLAFAKTEVQEWMMFVSSNNELINDFTNTICIFEERINAYNPKELKGEFYTQTDFANLHKINIAKWIQTIKENSEIDSWGVLNDEKIYYSKYTLSKKEIILRKMLNLENNFIPVIYRTKLFFDKEFKAVYREYNINIKYVPQAECEGLIFYEKNNFNNFKILNDINYLENSFKNILKIKSDKKLIELLNDTDAINVKKGLIRLYNINEALGTWDREYLLRCIAERCKSLKNSNQYEIANVNNIFEIFGDEYSISFYYRLKRFNRLNPTLKKKIKKITQRLIKRSKLENSNTLLMGEELMDRYLLIYHELNRIENEFIRLQREIFENTNEKVKYWTWERYERLQKDLKKLEQTINSENRYNQLKKDIDKSIERWTWERYERNMLYQQIMVNYMKMQKRIPYFLNEKIRVVFLVQVAAFFPSMEYLISESINDNRFEVKIVCYDEDVDPTIKVDTTYDFMKNKGLNFTYYKEFDIEEYRPHVVFLQTPYDGNRNNEWKSTMLLSKGYRIIYIPYGIEIADTQHARKAHFEGIVVKNAWRIYTFSELMKEDYNIYCTNSQSVRAIGIPRFDSLYFKKNYNLYPEIVEKSKQRKIVLWKVHFPKIIQENGKDIFVTPDIDEYIKFAKCLKRYENLYFIFMPHPRFKEYNLEPTVQVKIEQLFSELAKNSNVYIDDSDDYRNSLLNADYIIIDRSAVMVEAGVVGVPVLYMHNKDFEEPLTKAIAPLIESYYQGVSCEDMLDFVDMCCDGKDIKKEKRERAVKKYIPFFDGKSSERILNDIASGVASEQKGYLSDVEKIIDNKLEDFYLKIEALINSKYFEEK